MQHVVAASSKDVATLRALVDGSMTLDKKTSPKSGVLSKEGYRVKTWKKRFCVASSLGCLLYFKSAADAIPQGGLSLVGASLTVLDGHLLIESPRSFTRQKTGRLEEASARQFRFRSVSSDPDELRQWLTALSSLRRGTDAESSPSPRPLSLSPRPVSSPPPAKEAAALARSPSPKPAAAVPEVSSDVAEAAPTKISAKVVSSTLPPAVAVVLERPISSEDVRALPSAPVAAAAAVVAPSPPKAGSVAGGRARAPVWRMVVQRTQRAVQHAMVSGSVASQLALLLAVASWPLRSFTALLVALCLAAYAAASGYWRELVVTRGTVVVTDCAGGIGRRMALLLAKRGFHVLASHRRDADAESLRSEAAAVGAADRFQTFRWELTSEASTVEAAGRVVSQLAAGWPPLAALVLNVVAADAGGNTTVELLPEAELRAAMDTNFFGPLRLLQRLLGPLRDGRGRVVAVSSVLGNVALADPGNSALCASKAALECAVRCVARETRAAGICCVTLQLPGQERLPVPSGAGIPRFFSRLRTPERYLAASDAAAQGVLEAVAARSPRTTLFIGDFEGTLAVWLSRLLPESAMDAVASWEFRGGAQ